MIKQSEIEEIKQLIKYGFDLKLISFELDIPIEQLIQWKKDIEISKVNNATKKGKTKQNNEPSKLDKMRQKYRQLYSASNKIDVALPKPLSQEDIELINTVLATIKQKIQEMQNLPKVEKRKIASTILPELRKIQSYQLPIQQAEKLYSLMYAKQLQGLNMHIADRIDYFINVYRRKSTSQLGDAIEVESNKAKSIEELQRLKKIITVDMLNVNTVLFSALKTKISNKIEAIQKKNAIDKIRNDVPRSIELIITDLVNGNLDIQKAKSIIDEEARKRVQSKPKTKFSLTEEQARRQILTQISTIIEGKADKYPVQNPKNTILQMQKLSDGEVYMSFRTVVYNLIARKQFNTAKTICDEFAKKDIEENIEKGYTESKNARYIRMLMNDIRNEEIGDIVMTAINMNGTPEEESAYIKFIERTLKMENIRPSTIRLGKSEDGIRSITLADIWEPEKAR